MRLPLLSTVALVLTAAAAPAGAAGLPFVADDYPKALAEARARNRPLFVEAWAPW